MQRSSPVVEMAAARQRLAEYGRRNAELFTSLDMDRPVRKSEWTVGETASHLIFALRGFTESAAGNYGEWVALEDRIPKLRTPDRVAALNRVMIPAEPHLGSAAAGQAIAAGVDRFLEVTAPLPPGQPMPTPWYGEGETLTIAEATRLLLGEQVMHGYDVARSFGRKWPITRQDGLLIFEMGQTMMPKIADPAAIGTTSATFKLHLRGGPAAVVRIADGRAVVEAPAGQHVDCHVLADPVAFDLVAYGRVNQWAAIAKGKLFTYGTKPWLAFKFKSYFSNP